MKEISLPRVEDPILKWKDKYKIQIRSTQILHPSGEVEEVPYVYWPPWPTAEEWREFSRLLDKGSSVS